MGETGGNVDCVVGVGGCVLVVIRRIHLGLKVGMVEVKGEGDEG